MTTGIGTVAPGTAAPSSTAAMRAAILAFGNKPRTYTTPDGTVRRTAAWTLFLQQRGLLDAPGAPPGLPATATPQPLTVGPPPKPTTPPQNGYEWQLINGQWIQKLVLTDPRDGEYQQQVGQAAYERQRGLNQVEADRARYASLYNRGAADIRQGYNRNRYDSNAELAQRGIIRSGEYQHRGVDRENSRVRQVADLESQYGSGALSQLAARVNDINTQYGFAEQGALQAAKDRFAQRYPASPYIAGAVG